MKILVGIYNCVVRKHLLFIRPPSPLHLHVYVLCYGVLSAFFKAGLTVNKVKYEFNKTSIVFFGLLFSAGVKPDPAKVEALKQPEPPKSKSELKSFLGVVNFSADFIDQYADLTAELRNLTHDKVKWKWEQYLQEAFNRIKNTLSEEALLNSFNPDWETKVICDGSPVGIGIILIQIQPQTRQRKVVAYVSRELRVPETNREALPIYFSCLILQIYLLGKPFTVVMNP